MADTVKLRVEDVKNDYQLMHKVGCGTYGTVFKARNRRTQQFVAFKKIQNKEIKLQADGFPITALREIDLLKRLNHLNVVRLKEIIVSKPSERNLFRGSTFLVFEYVEHDFAGLFKNSIKFPLSNIKCFMRQILEGVAYIHKEKFLHRDLKSANILLTAAGVVKIADFGLGRKSRPDGRYTSKVVTLYYRAPQLLLGARQYSSKIDMWSLGCIFAQFFIHDVLFKWNEYNQLENIIDICGGVEENQFFDPKASQEDRLKHFTLYKKQIGPKPIKIIEYLKKSDVDQSTAQFLSQFLQLNPNKRISAADALNHPFFQQSPLACEPKDVQQLNTEYHEILSKKMIEKTGHNNDYRYNLNKGFDADKNPHKDSGRNYFARDDKNFKDNKGWGREGDFKNYDNKNYSRDKYRDYNQYKAVSKDSFVSEDYTVDDHTNNRYLKQNQTKPTTKAFHDFKDEKNEGRQRRKDQRRYSPHRERNVKDIQKSSRKQYPERQDRNYQQYTYQKNRNSPDKN